MINYSPKGQREFHDYVENKKRTISELPIECQKSLYEQLEEVVRNYESRKIAYLNQVIYEKRREQELEAKNPLKILFNNLNSSLLKIRDNIRNTNKNYTQIERGLREIIKTEEKTGQKIREATKKIQNHLRNNRLENRQN